MTATDDNLDVSELDQADKAIVVRVTDSNRWSNDAIVVEISVAPGRHRRQLARYRWRIPHLRLGGSSAMPLLEACTRLLAIGISAEELVITKRWRSGRWIPSMRTTVGYGAQVARILGRQRATAADAA